jgi:hypothetical protein
MSFLTTSFIFPLLVLLGSIVIDVQNYTAQAVSLQDAVDDAALVGTKYLPNVGLAQSVASDLIKRRVPSATLLVTVKSDSLSITADQKFYPFLASFFTNVQGQEGYEFSLPLKAISYGKITPVDLFLAIERGSRVAPSLSATADERLGDQQSFPVPLYFSQNQISQGSHIIPPEIALEQCFNPRFNKIKETSIRVLDSVAGSALHRLSVSFFPGSRTFRGNNRALQKFQNPDVATFYDTYPDSDNGTPVVVNELENSFDNGKPIFPVQSVQCASVAQNVFSSTTYQFPKKPNYIESSNQNLINDTDLAINQSYPLTYAEPIWSRVAYPTALFDTNLSLQSMIADFNSTNADTNRGGLINRARQVGVFVSVGLPQVQGVTLQHEDDPVWNALDGTLSNIQAIKRRENNRLTILYIMLESTQSEASLVERLFQRHQELGVDGQPVFQAKVFTGEHFQSLISETIPSILRGEQGSVIAR